MKLELKHYTSYLPYKVKGLWENLACEIEGCDLHKKDTVIVERVSVNIAEVRLILRPLKEIFEIEEIDEQFSEYSKESFINSFFLLGGCLNRFDHVNYTIVELCFKHHIDIFGLIPKGLAIDVNTLKNK